MEILIADDDKLITQGMSMMIKEAFPEISITECYDGMSAWNSIEERAYDLVITDMEMPRLSGEELIERIDRAIPIIVISCYDDYSKVRNALLHGASDYLLKPVNQGELIAAIRSILTISSEEIPEGNEKYGGIIPLHHTVMLQTDSKEGAALLSRLVSAMAAEDIPYHQEQYQREYTILSSDSDSFRPLMEGFRSPFLSIPAAEEEGMDRDELAAMLCSRLIDTFNDIHPRELPEISATELFRKMAEAVSMGKERTFTHYADMLVDSFAYQRAAREFTIRSISLWFYQMLEDNPDMIHILQKNLFSDMDFNEALINSHTISEIREAMHSIIPFYIQQAHMSPAEDMRIEKIRRYIADNLGKDISLESTARMLEMHPNYLSAFFKQKMGISFRDYLKKARMEKAQELMKTTNLKLYQIAELVGYSDPAHFSRTYRQVFGTNPLSWKQ